MAQVLLPTEPSAGRPAGQREGAAAATPLWQRRGLRKLQPKLSLSRERSAEQEQDIERSRQAFASAYSVVDTVGHGSTACVQHAVRQFDGRHVALKIMRTEDPEMVAFAKREFDLLKSIEHPSIVRALDFVEAPGRAVLVMDFFDGRDLLETVRSMPEGCLPEHLAMPLVSQLCDAVSHLHSRHIVHRDIKPQNVLVSKDLKQLKLIDFNVAHSLQEAQALTPTGTQLYAAPEVVLGESPSECSDFWAVGLCAHLLLSGRLPQGRDRCESHMASVQACAAQEVFLRGPSWAQVSEQCKASLRQCLAAEPSARILPDCSGSTHCCAGRLTHHRLSSISTASTSSGQSIAESIAESVTSAAESRSSSQEP